MENIERINIDFSGYMEMDKNDIVLRTIDDNGDFQPVNVQQLTSDEIVQGVREGVYYIDLVKCYEKQLDGQEDFTIEKEED